MIVKKPCLAQTHFENGRNACTPIALIFCLYAFHGDPFKNIDYNIVMRTGSALWAHWRKVSRSRYEFAQVNEVVENAPNDLLRNALEVAGDTHGCMIDQLNEYGDPTINTSLSTSLEKHLQTNVAAILTRGNYTVGIVHQQNGCIYLFDSHPTDDNGFPDFTRGTRATIARLRDLDALIDYINTRYGAGGIDDARKRSLIEYSAARSRQAPPRTEWDTQAGVCNRTEDEIRALYYNLYFFRLKDD